MTFNAQQFLDQHGGDALAALAALEAQRSEAQEGRDREGRAAQAARRERDSARSELDTAREELRTAQQNAAPEGAVVLTGEDAQFWQAQQGREHLQQRISRADDADRLERTVTLQRAASASGLTEAELSEWLGERQLTSGKAKDKDGKDVDAYGLTVKGEDGKDVFKPLTEFPTFQKLAQPVQQGPRLPQQHLPNTQTTTPEAMQQQMALSGQYVL